MGQEIRFIRNKEGKRGIAVSLAGTVYISETPVEIEVKESGGGFHLYRSGYEKAEEVKNGYQCQVLVDTAYGSRLEVSDTYQWKWEKMDLKACQGPEEEAVSDGCQMAAEEIVFTRRVQVIREHGREVGFSSSFALHEEGRYSLDDYEVFIPGIWYRRNENVVDKAFGSNARDRYHYIRITRMAMPYVE